MAASIVVAGPVPLDLTAAKRPDTDLLIRRGLLEAKARGLEKRLSADFSMEKAWYQEDLFSGSWSEGHGSVSETDTLTVTCVDCWTTGMVTARLSDEQKLRPKVKLEFTGVEAYVNVRLQMSVGHTYTINLFTSQTPIGLGLPGLNVGLVFSVDLVFGLSSAVDLTGGFYVKLADDAYLTTDIFGGKFADSFFDGLSSKSLPVSITIDQVTFKADLRLRVECGAEATSDLFGIGAGAAVGIYVNVIEFVSVVESTPTCELQSTEWWDLNVGAYAKLSVVVNFKTIGPVPTVSTALLTAPTMTQCWKEIATVESGLAVRSAPSTTMRVTPSPRLLQATPVITPAATVSSVSPGLSDGSAPSAIYSTTVYTITICAADVVNCPATLQEEVVVTQTKGASTTSCPASEITCPISKPSIAAIDIATPAVHALDDLVILTVCESPAISTFVPPAPVNISAPQQKRNLGYKRHYHFPAASLAE